MVLTNYSIFYIFPLEFNLGYTLCKYTDFTDITPFTGNVICIYNTFFVNINESIKVNSISNSEILFGPCPLYKKPNSKGKGAWKYIEKVENCNMDMPIFKMTNHTISLWKTHDWSKIETWQKKYDFNSGGGYCNYESLRSLELPILCSMREIEVRTTMHYLILNNKKVEEYYDLNDSENRDVYLKMVNTSFDKKQTLLLIKALS